MPGRNLLQLSFHHLLLLLVLCNDSKSLFRSLDVLLDLLHVVLKSLHALLVVHRSGIAPLRPTPPDVSLGVVAADLVGLARLLIMVHFVD